MTSKEIRTGSAQRPKSAVETNRFASQSLGRFFQQQTDVIDEKTVNSIWKGLGSYIAKQLRNGKGISVPKFGNFSFSAPNVDLGGTTNPDIRDKQIREPVFLVGKDFVSAVPLRTGVSHQGGSAIRPYDIKGASGIIPKVKINYTEVAVLCSQNKDICRNGCEQVFRFLSDKVRKGETVSMDIPFVGTFLVRSGIAAIAFNSDVSEETRGVTAKNHYVNKLFANSVNRHNLQLADQNKMKENPTVGLGGAMRLTNDAENWLKSNLNISVQEIISRPAESRQTERIQSAKQIGNAGLNRYSSMKPDDERKKSWAINNGSLTEQNKQLFDKLSDKRSLPSTKRPMSAVSRVTGSSRMTNIPEVNRMKLMIIVNDIYRNRSAISEVLNQTKSSLRDVLSSSEIQQILKRTGLFIEITNIKAMLKEFGFNWNGPACSIMDLFSSCKVFIYGSTTKEENQGTYYTSIGASKQNDDIQASNSYNYNKKIQNDQRSAQDVLQMIKDLFYSTQKTIYEIYTEARLGQVIDSEGLIRVVQMYSGNSVSESEVQSVFTLIAKGKREITYQEFESTFNWKLQVGGDWETKCFRSIRDWMFKNNLSSDTTFDLLLRNSGKQVQKRMNRVDFHKGISQCGLKFTAPEIDGLFKILDMNEDGELDLEEWRMRIYEDSLNPLQMLREVVTNNNITADDLLFKMKMRIWDEPLDFIKFCEGLRRLDPTLSETQIRHLAKTLKNKDNKVEIPALLRNLCGKEHETVDFRNKIFREIYSEIHPQKEDQLLQLLENADPLNDGRVEPQGLKVALRKVVKSVDEDSIDRFIRFLDKDQSGKVNYMEFMQRMSEVSNRDHNPFKSVVQRLQYFIQSNEQSIQSILKRLAVKKSQSNLGPSSEAIPIELFAQFLKAKIDKKRDIGSLRKFAHFMDIDKDGFITEIDLQTCLNNLNSDAFFKNNGEALASSAFSSAKKFFPSQTNGLSEDRVVEIIKQIRTSLINQKIAYREAFNRFDQNKDGFLSFGEFSSGIDKIITLSIPIKEKLFAYMDRNKIGLVDYPIFLEVIQMSSASTKKKGEFEDNFDWENQVIDQIRQWINVQRITVDEGFKCFDKDFDGFISKDDLKYSLINILEIKADTIFPTKLDRLFRLMDFYKTNTIQLSDFQRILQNENPYSSSGARGIPSTDNFSKSFGGSFAQTSTFDWKLSAIQQIGLVMSKKYSTLQQSFEEASEHLQKITYDQFKKFIESNRALTGFNMTIPLIQKLFSELDPHKKGYLNENDWINAFQAFKWNDQIFIDLKNVVQCSFANVESAFQFFLTFKSKQNQSKSIQFSEFESAVNSLTSERFKDKEIQSLWKNLTEGTKQNSIDLYQFRQHFDNIKYTGTSTVRNIKSALPGARTTIVSQTSSSSQWEQDIFEKLRTIIRTSTKSFEEIFKEFDEDGNGTISLNEFRNCMRKLNIGLTSREIDKLMEKIDTNSDGKIDWNEFISKFKTSQLDERLKERAKDKMARIKELMLLHMTSPNDAFRFFDETKLGKLSYQEFSKLIVKLYQVANDKCPAYPVIKDLFDTIDIRKDGILDINEWQQTFGNVTEGNNQLSIKTTPLSLWENSREFSGIGNLIARNRKLLKESFEKVVGNSKSNEVTFDQAKKAMEGLLQDHCKGLSDEKLKCVLRIAEISGASSQIGSHYDYMRILDVYKNRHAAPQM